MVSKTLQHHVFATFFFLHSFPLFFRPGKTVNLASNKSKIIFYIMPMPNNQKRGKKAYTYAKPIKRNWSEQMSLGYSHGINDKRIFISSAHTPRIIHTHSRMQKKADTHGGSQHRQSTVVSQKDEGKKQASKDNKKIFTHTHKHTYIIYFIYWLWYRNDLMRNDNKKWQHRNCSLTFYRLYKAAECVSIHSETYTYIDTYTTRTERWFSHIVVIAMMCLLRCVCMRDQDRKVKLLISVFCANGWTCNC